MFRYYCLFFTLALGLQSASDPWIGTWRLDKAKSHFENYDGPTSDAKLDITSEGNNYRLVFTVPGKAARCNKSRLRRPRRAAKFPATWTNLGCLRGADPEELSHGSNASTRTRIRYRRDHQYEDLLVYASRLLRLPERFP